MSGRRGEEAGRSAEADEDPFAVLGLGPTSVVGEVKRAYFSALQRHPPHADPEGFRRIRGAYERLMKPGALATLAWTSSFDADAARRGLEASLLPRLATARAQGSRSEASLLLRRHFGRSIASVSWAELTAAFARSAGDP